MPNIEQLGIKLGSSDAEERREAAVDLGRLGGDAVPMLFRAMEDVDWRVRKAAVEALVSIGGTHVINRLLQALSVSDNAGMRNSAIEALVQIGGQAVDSLLRTIENPDPDVRKFVVDILGDIMDRRAVPALCNRLADDDENVRVASAEALGKIRDPRAVDVLLACFARPDEVWLHYAVAEALGAIGDERALGQLLSVLGSGSLREPVLESLGRIGSAETIGPLVIGLADPLRIVREVSIAAIAAIYRKSAALERYKVVDAVKGGLTEISVNLLEEVLITSSGELLKSTITLLGWSGRGGSIRKLLAVLTEEDLEETVVQSLQYLERRQAAFLIEYLTHENALVRRTVARILGDLAVSAAESPLITLLKDENGHVRSTAALALGRMRSRKASAALLALLADEYESVQESAIQALAVIGDESVLERLISDFATRNTLMRRNIALLLGKFSSERAIDALTFALKDEEPVVRKAVVQALGNVAGEKTLRSLMLAITDDDPEIRRLAAEVLGRSKTAEARAALLPLLNDEDIWVRASATRGLGEMGGEEVIDALVAHLENAADIFLLAIVDVLGRLKPSKGREPLLKLAGHPDSEIRKAVIVALASYGESLQQVIIDHLSDPHWSVRKAAVEALKRQRSASVDALLTKIADSDPDVTVRQACREALGI
jgi:HEAT repeat protein